MEKTGYLLLNEEGFKLGFMEKDTMKLKEMYKLLDCRIVEVVSLTKDIDIWVDEEGLLKSKNIVTEIYFEEESLRLAGNLLFLKNDNDGNIIGLNGEDIDFLNASIKHRIIGYTA